MNGDGGVSAPPQVIRRSDGSLAVLNVDTRDLSDVQKIALAAQVWDQARLLMEASGEYKPRDPHLVAQATGIGSTRDVDRKLAPALGVTQTSLSKVRPRLVANKAVRERALAGEIDTFDNLSRELGMVVKATLAEGRPSKARFSNSFFGLGDKFDSSIEPLVRYLRSWRHKSFRFSHVNPREAKRRIKQIDNVMADLAAAREDLVRRSHVATYATPSEKRRENTAR